MKIVSLDEQKIAGVTVRTSNAIEMSNERKIPALWKEFKKALAQIDVPDVVPVGVYWDYESGMNAPFNVTAGMEIGDNPAIKGLSSQITIQAGRYLRFSKAGIMPAAVVELWGEIWEYFSDPNSEFKRAYTTDFERYKSPYEVEIYISIL